MSLAGQIKSFLIFLLAYCMYFIKICFQLNKWYVLKMLELESSIHVVLLTRLKIGVKNFWIPEQLLYYLRTIDKEGWELRPSKINPVYSLLCPYQSFLFLLEFSTSPSSQILSKHF